MRFGPAIAAIPLVLDSPHSGEVYPPDFDHSCPRDSLRSMSDPYMDQLAMPATEYGAIVIAAMFPRTYVDPNRDDDAIDPELLSDAWSGPMVQSSQTSVGRGVVFRRLPRIRGRHQMPTDIYDNKLTSADVRHRIDRYWRPYHAMLRGTLDDVHERFSCVLHLDMHSCYPSGLAERDGEGGDNPDVTLTDNTGSSASSHVTEALAARFRAHGWWVGINDPFPSSSIARRYGSPETGRHSIMIEVNRRRHLDIATLEPSAEFDNCRAVLTSVYAFFAAEWRHLLKPAVVQR
jgi:N-formylglutamate amidohydrolase